MIRREEGEKERRELNAASDNAVDRRNRVSRRRDPVFRAGPFFFSSSSVGAPLSETRTAHRAAVAADPGGDGCCIR